MTIPARLGVIVDVDGTAQAGTPRRQWRRLRGLLRASVRDLRSTFGMPQLVSTLVAEAGNAPVFYVSALPAGFHRRIDGLLAHDGYPSGRLLTAPRSWRLWRVFAGGRTDKRATLERLLADPSVERWLLIGDDGGHAPEAFGDVIAQAPDRVSVVGMRQTLAPDETRTGLQVTDHLHGVPVVLAPNGAELLPRLRAAAGLRQRPAAGPGDWLLSAAERGNDATRLRAWTEGNDARALVDGSSYFPVLAAALAGAGAGDTVLLGGWRCDGDEQLGPAGPTVAQALRGAAQRGGVVRGLLWRSHASSLGYHLEPNLQTAAALASVGGHVLLDERARPLGCHHQKFVAVRHPQRPADDVAFVGGIDLDRGSHDDAEHAGDPQPVTTSSTRYGPTPAKHDVHVQLHGPAVAEIDEVFRERWDDPAPLTRLPWQTLYDRVRRLPRTAPSLPAATSAPSRAGTCTVQVLRTYPARRPRSPFAPRGERSIARAYAKALGRAQRLIYVEDQYLWSVDVARLFAAALRRAPRLHLIAVVPRYPDVEGRTYLETARLGHGEALAMVHEAGGDRVQVLDIENHDGLPIYVHAKLTVVDDVWAAVGSANLNVRSWTHDSELSVAIFDEQRDTRAPADPGGLGDGARRFARQLRLQLMREHLGLGDSVGSDPDPNDELLLDPERAAQTVRDCAADLDAWHEGGSRGPRPPGRLRRHDLEAPAAWTRWLTTPAYRTFLDPDGRLLGMRLRRSY